MVDVLKDLPKPFFVLAPMDDVTDTVFRQIVAECTPPDLFFTEFVNVDGLQSPGRERLLPKLKFTSKEHPIIAQIWGKNPENYYKTTKEIVDGTLAAEASGLHSIDSRNIDSDEMQGDKEKRASRTGGTASEFRMQAMQQFAVNSSKLAGFASEQSAMVNFSGVDVNMGCPDKAVVKNGCCSALINNRQLAEEIIKAVKDATGDYFPISVKTRVGFTTIDLSWIEFLLKQKLNMLTIHLRTAKEMSKVPARWELMKEIVAMRDRLSPATLLVGNGDVLTRRQGEGLAKQYDLDGIMIGRGIFYDPYIFAKQSVWAQITKQQRVDLYKKHVELFTKTWQNNERRVPTLNKFCKMYIQNFAGAKDLREVLMHTQTSHELLDILEGL